MGIAERKEREKEQRRNAIIDAAEKVFFSKGVENATMDEVAEEAELSKGTLYLYFKNKTDLFHAIVARALNMLYNDFKKVTKKEKKGIDKIKSIGKAYFQFYKNQPDYYGTLLHQDIYEFTPDDPEENFNVTLCMETGNKIFGLMRECVLAGIEDGTIREDLDPAKLPVILWGHSSGVLHLLKSKGQMIEKKFECTSEEIIEYSFQMVVNYLEKRDAE